MALEITHDGYVMHKVQVSPVATFTYEDMMGNEKGKHGFIDDINCETYWENGELHRIEGPAVIFGDEYAMWYFEGEKHCLDGPAVIEADGENEYWLYGDKLEKEEDLFTYVKPTKRG